MVSPERSRLHRLRRHLLGGLIAFAVGSPLGLLPDHIDAQTWDPWVRVALWAGYSHHCSGCEFEGSWKGGQFVLKVEVTPKGFFSSPGALTLGGGASLGGVRSHHYLPWVGPPVRENFDQGSTFSGGGPAPLPSRREAATPLLAGPVFELIPFELSQRLFCSSTTGPGSGTKNRWGEKLRWDFKAVLGLGFTIQDDVVPRVVDNVPHVAIAGGVGLVASPGLTLSYTPDQEGDSVFSHLSLNAQLRVPLHWVHSDLIHPDGYVEQRDFRLLGRHERWHVEPWSFLVGVSLPFGKRWREPFETHSLLVRPYYRQPDTTVVHSMLTEVVGTAGDLVGYFLGRERELSVEAVSALDAAGSARTFANWASQVQENLLVRSGTPQTAEAHTKRVNFMLGQAVGLVGLSSQMSVLAELAVSDDDLRIRTIQTPIFANQYLEWLKRKQIMCGNPESYLGRFWNRVFG